MTKKLRKPLFDEFVPFETDDMTGSSISAAHLPFYQGGAQSAEIDAAFEAIEAWPTKEVFYKAASYLVFHARHLSPVQHAQLAYWLQSPYRGPAGRPPKRGLQKAAYEVVQAGDYPTSDYAVKGRLFVRDQLARIYDVDPDTARRALKAAEEAWSVDRKKRK